MITLPRRVIYATRCSHSHQYCGTGQQASPTTSMRSLETSARGLGWRTWRHHLDIQLQRRVARGIVGRSSVSRSDWDGRQTSWESSAGECCAVAALWAPRDPRPLGRNCPRRRAKGPGSSPGSRPRMLAGPCSDESKKKPKKNSYKKAKKKRGQAVTQEVVPGCWQAYTLMGSKSDRRKIVAKILSHLHSSLGCVVCVKFTIFLIPPGTLPRARVFEVDYRNHGLPRVL